MSVVTEEDLCKLFGFKTTNYLQKNVKLNDLCDSKRIIV